jgi:hypothetical protein
MGRLHNVFNNWSAEHGALRTHRENRFLLPEIRLGPEQIRAIFVPFQECNKLTILLRFSRIPARKFFRSDSRKRANRVQVLRFGPREFTVRLRSSLPANTVTPSFAEMATTARRTRTTRRCRNFTTHQPTLFGHRKTPLGALKQESLAVQR